MGEFDLTPEDRERAGRKPLPKTLRAWMAEIEGTQSFIKQRVQLKDANGVKWLHSMQSYHRARMLLLTETPPALLPKEAARIIVREVVRGLK